MAADTTLLPSSSDRRAGAVSSQVRNAAIHPDQRPTSDQEIGAPTRLGRRSERNWTISAAFVGIVLLALNLRSAVTSVPPLLERISAELGFSATVIGLLGALPALAFSAAGLIGVRLLRRFSAERIAVGVLLVEALGQLLRPWSGSAAGFLIVSGFAMLGMGVGNVILPALVKAWFPTRIGMTTAAYVTALTIGTSVPALVAVPIAANLGWHRGLALWGAIALLPIPAWLIAARRARVLPVPRALPAASSASQQPALNPPDQPHRVAVHRSPITWGLALLFGMNALNLYALFTWLPVRLIDAGASEARAGAMLALFSGIGVIPSFLIPMLLGRLGRAGWMAAACVGFFAVGYAGLLFLPMTLTPLWTVLAGLGGGGFPLVLTLIGLRSATPASAGALAGVAQGVGYLAAASGPLLVGLLHDLTGGWTAPFGFLAGTLVLMLVGGWLCSGDTTVDDDLRRRAADRPGGVEG
jgi:CP family cyanate transporter-like MFS transporter